MNFYKHHIGDFDADTAHLSWLEDAAYRRLMCLYYRREEPVPGDIGQACRLVRAVSKQERAAVETILREFFFLADDGWRNKRCDLEIEAAKDKADKNRTVGKLGGRPPKPRTATVTTDNHDGFKKPPNTKPNDNPSQTPDARHQEKARAAAVDVEARAPVDVEGHQPTDAGRLCLAMRKAGLQQTNPSDPRLRALIDQGVTEAECTSVAAEAAAGAKGWPWVLKVIEARRTEAAAIVLAPRPVDTAAAASVDATQAYLAEQARQREASKSADAQTARLRAVSAIRASAS